MKKQSKRSVVKSTVEIMKEKAESRSQQIKKAKANLKKAAQLRRDAMKKQMKERKKIEAKLGPKNFQKADLDRFRSLILEKRQEMLEELDTLKESMMDVTTGEYNSESSSYSLHMEQGTDAMEREKTFLFAARGGKFVNQLDDALTRIRNDTYGQCRVCGRLVPKERLEAVPTAQTCAEYKNTNVPCDRGKLALSIKQIEAE